MAGADATAATRVTLDTGNVAAAGADLSAAYVVQLDTGTISVLGDDRGLRIRPDGWILPGETQPVSQRLGAAALGAQPPRQDRTPAITLRQETQLLVQQNQSALDGREEFGGLADLDLHPEPTVLDRASSS